MPDNDSRVSSLEAELAEIRSALQRNESELGKRTAELERVKSEIKKVDFIKSDLIDNLCHELRTPLASIRGYAELISKGKMGDTNEKQDRALSIVLKNIDKMLVLIDGLAEFSKIQSFKNTLNFRRIDIVNVIRESLAALATKSIDRRVPIDFVPPPHPVFVNADYSQLNFLFTNLIDAAIKSKKNCDPIKIKADFSKTDVTVSISDTEIFFDDEAAARVMDRVNRDQSLICHETAAIAPELSLAFEVLKLHGGRLALKKEASGCEFSLAFPLYIEDEIADYKAAGSKAEKRRKILITDDDPDCVSLLKTILENDYDLVVTNSASAMFRALETHKDCSLILLDINLAELDGIAICRMLKEKKEYAGIPVLMISASLQEMKKQKSLEAGAMGFLEKPFQTDKVSEFIGSLIL